ncbi:hypothetical protein ACFLUJ_04530 [Chloroflexota bacterium]
MKGQNRKLTSEQESAIEALIDKPTLKSAAVSIGISEMILQQWKTLPEFDAKYRAARDQVLEDATEYLQKAQSLAIIRLVGYLHCRRADLEMRATRAILSHSRKSKQTNNLQTRVKAIENSLKSINEAKNE